MFLGVATPFFGGTGSEPFLTDLAGVWPLLALAGVVVVAAVDAGRGSAAGLGVAAGAALAFVPFQGFLLRLVTEWSSIPGFDVPLGPGFWSWTLAAVIGAVLVVVALGGRLDDRTTAAPVGLGALLVVAGGVWTFGIVQPPSGFGSVGDHLFGDDAATNVLTVVLLGGPVLACLVAAVRRTSAAYGLVLGVASFWLCTWVVSASGYRASGEQLLAYQEGSFAVVGAGVVSVTVLAAVGLVLARSPAAGGGGTGLHRLTPLPAVAVAVLVAAPVLGVVAVASQDDRDRLDHAGSDVCIDDPWLCEGGYGIDPYDDPYAYDDYGGDGVPPELQPGARDHGVATPPSASCPTGSSRPELQRYWYGDGGLHVVVVITTTCPTPQRLADADARFGLYAAGESFVEASFDFSTTPVAVPASGRSAEIELVFDPARSSMNVTALEAVELPTSEATAADAGFDVHYRFVCEPSDGDGDHRRSRVSSRRGVDPAGSRSDAVEPAPIVDGPAIGLSGDDALRELERIAAGDRPFVYAALYDEWVPQLSAKQIGVTDPTTGITFDDHGKILDHYRDLLARYPDVRLVNSSTYSSFRYPGYWVVVHGTPHRSSDAANAWCDREGWGRDDCYAKRINHGDFDGNTRLRD